MRKSIVTAVFILVFAGCISESVYAGIPADERNALIDLYNNTKYLGWTDSTNWLGTAGTECTWYGINCDDSETSVTGIILINNNLAGNIPESIENFMNLKRLNLSYNQLTGNIPESIGNLTNLKRLNLSYNQLTGNIPESIGNFTNLITINLSYNQLTGTIPNSVINLVNLQVADVGLNNLTGNIPLELGYLTNLTHLYLHYNDLDGNIPPELGNLINLELLRLGHNRLTGNIPPELGNLANLTMLTFESNQLTGEIPIQLGELYNLENGKNGFRWNALYASDDNLSIFLNTKQSGGNWESSQTVTPDYLEAIITDDENFTPISVPLAWSPSPLPSINDAESGYSISYSTTSGAYTQSVTVTGNDTEYAVVSGLTPDTTYYFALRSFTGPHTNNGNIVYSEYTDEVSAATPVAYPPIVTTALISETSASEAAGGGEVTDYGYSAITARGVCWNTSANPDITDNYLGITDDNTNAFSGDFTSKLTGLTPVTQYFVKAYAVNGKGTSYGKEVEFTTPPDVPSVVTEEVTSVTSYTAESGGEVISDGGAPVTAKGVCWSTLFIDNSIELEDLYHTEDGSGTGSFTSSISDLEPGKLYFLRSYAVNSAGTAYGNQFFFDTPAVKPTVETADAASVTETGVSAGGTVTSDGGATVTARGLCWSTSVIDDTTKLEEIDHTEDGSGTGSFTSSITGLNPNTTYHIRAYATNIKGTSFGSDKSFKTKTDNPKVETGSAGNVTATEASCSGNVVSDGGAPVTARGVCWSVYENPTIEDAYTADGSGTGNFTSSITGLTPDTTYYVRAYASNIEKTGYGNQVTFKTDPVVPSVTTEKASSVSKTGALSGGNVVSDGGTPVTARGVCWSVYENPTIKDAYISGGSGTGSFTSSISGLNSGTTYYIRAYATNSRGTAYGQNESFTTKSGMPELTTSAVPESAVTETSASCGGKIISDGGYPVTARGVCWNTAEAPTIEDNYTTSGSGTGEFESLISGLTPMTTYYTRAYATNSQGTAYGQNESFATEGARPSVSTDGAVALSLHSASFFGNISSDGGTDVTERGFCWNTSGFPTLGANSNKISSGDGTGSFTAEVSGLDSGMLYYVRAYAINDIGTGYGNQLFFYTPAPAKPKVDTVAAFDITPGAALCGGEVIHNGGYSVTARGVCWNTSDVPDTAEPADFDHTTDGTGTGSFTSSISGLTPDTTYYTRAYATSSEGTGYGEQLFFHTPALAKPQVTTAPVTDITPTAVSCGGEVISDGWLPVSARGVCWSTSDNPETDNNDGITSQGTGTGSFTSSITGLSPDTIYYVRAYAVNSLGTAYGKQESFSTDTTPPTVISTSPADNATDMALNAVITAVFSEPVDITTVTSSAFYISDGSGNIPGTITYSDNSVTLTPDAYVDIGPTYTATITTRVTDLAGNPLNADYTWSFSYDKDKEWNWQNPLPTGNTIREIWGSAETGIFAAGDAGTVLWQDGSGWKEMKTSTYKNLRGIWGSSDSNIFAVGEAGRIINYNGEEWVVASSHTSDNLNGIWGSSDSDIFAVGQEGTILHFDGIEWTGVTSITDNDLFDVWGRTDSDVFAAGSAGTILYYNGTEWIGLDSGVTENLYSIWGHSGSDVYAVGHAGTILNYDGNEWIELDSGVSENLYNVWGSGSDVYVAGHAGTILHYDGTVWKKMETGITLNLYGIRASSDSDVYAVGQFGTILHYGGTGWSKTNTGTTARLRHVWGTSAESDLIAAGNAGMILRYNGTDWKKEPGNMSENLNCVWGSSDSDIFVVGESGVILHNNGTEWKEQLGNISENLNSVWGNSDSDVYAVGDIGTILHFDGAEWIQTDSSVTENLYGIWGSSESDIFAVGQAGIILHFDGAEWIQTDSGVTENLYDIWGSSETDVFAVGHAGTILHYDGTEWTQTDSSISENLYSIWGSSETDVFAAGHSGTILHCDGTEWKWMKSGTFNFLEGIWGSSGSDVYAVGQSGTILHYDAELPFVDSTSPENNSTGISSETEPAATFSEPMKKSSFTSETFFLLSDDSDDKIKGTVQYDEEGMTVKFIPEQGLAEDKTYTAIITADVADLAGNPMEAEFTWSFITGPVPVIISTVPANDGVSASLHTDITAVFSEPVKVSSLTTETFTLYDGSDKAVEGTVQYDEEGMTVKFIQEQGLAEDKTYTAIITADVADLAGNPLGTEFTWSFTTGPAPVIISTVPANGGVGASLNTDITAVFSEPVKVSSLTNETFTVYDDSDRIVDGTVDYDEENMAAIFKPTVSLNYKTIYHAAITVDITDMAGNPLKADYNWSFTTANYNVPPPLTNPENGETEVPADTEFITAVFTEQMNKSTLTNDTFYITYNSGVKAEGTVDYDEESMTAIFIPAHSLNYNTMYNATITTGFTNIAGDSMANNYTWSFTTGDDNKRPAIVSVFPANNAVDISLSPEVIVTFSEPVIPASITNESFFVSDNSGAELSGTVNYDNTKTSATLTLAQSLNYNTAYTVTVTGDVTDLAGNTMGNEYVWTFKTELDTVPPKVVSKFPADGAPNVYVYTKVTATFSEGMEPSNITTDSFLLYNGSVNIPGTVEYAGKTATFIPGGDYTPYTTYTAVITSVVTDLAGNHMKENCKWLFTTGKDTKPPVVIKTSPENNAVDVAVNTVYITATFSEDMEPSAFTNATFFITGGTHYLFGTVSCEGDTAVLKLSKNLAPLTTYTVAINTYVTDTAGNRMEKDYEWSFKTGLDNIAPRVIATNPYNQAVKVPVEQEIRAAFSEPVDSQTVTIATFFVFDSSGNNVKGTVNYDEESMTATFKPINNFDYNTTYTVTVNTVVRDVAGNRLESDHTWSFTTLPEPPRVSATNPENSAVNIPVDAVLSAWFSNSMLSESLTKATFFVFDSSGNNVEGTVNYIEANKTATFRPVNNFAYNTTYTATINTVVRDLAGNRLEKNYVWSFTTIPEEQGNPTVVMTNPANNASDILRDAVISATFSEQILPETVTDTSFIVSDSSNNKLAGTVDYNETTLTATFTPTPGMSYDTVYTATVTAEVTDTDGIPMKSYYSWSFTTEQDNIPPIVDFTRPDNEAAKVSVNTSVRATFSEPLKSSGITDATFTVRAQGQEEQVPGVVTYSGMVAKFKSAEKLAYSTTYTAVISAGVEDLAGNALEADHTWSFTTGIAPDLTPPEVISTEPGNNTNDVAMDTTISATFSENIHPSSVSTDSFFVNDGIHYLQGTVTYYNKVVTFTPAEKLTPDTLFIATVTTDTRDFAGNHLETDYIWSFKTGVQPIVKSVTPADNETDVAVNAYVTATFSEPVKPSTINSSTFFLSSESGYISGTVSYSDTTAFFTPSENLADDTIYTATVTAGVENLAGNYLEADYTWSFKTGVRPIVKSVTPADNETGVAVDAYVTATFSEPVKPFTISNATFLVSGESGYINGTVSYSDTTAFFTPSENFDNDTTYTATVTADVEDLAGNRLEAEYTWSFKTVSENILPIVKSVTPADNETGVAVNAHVTATFSEPVKPSAISNATFFVSSESGYIIGTVSYSGTTALFTPSENLADDTIYTATVTADVEDLAGNRLENDFTWSFTTGSVIDNTPPTVSSAFPADNETDADLNISVTVVFSEPMEPFTINGSTFFVSSETGNIIGTISYSDTTATFTPAENFDNDTTYTATVTAGVRDIAGNRLENDFTWSFTTGSIIDNTPPTVSSSDPADRSANVAVNTAIGVTFSEHMEPGTIDTATFFIRHETENIPGTVEYNGTTATFSPAENFNCDTSYTATVTADVEDLAGNRLENDFTWSFTTGSKPDDTPPTVRFSDPSANSIDVAVDTAVAVAFSEPMKPSTVTTATFFVNNGTGKIAGTVAYDGTTGTFTPAGNFAHNTTYTVEISANAEDLAGNPLGNDYTWTFTTGLEPDTTLPSVCSTSPENKETLVNIDRAIAVTFSEPMKSSTVTTATFFVSNETGNIPGTVKYDGVTGTFIPGENFAFNTVYTVTVSTEATDLSGNPLENKYEWTFTTWPEPDTTLPRVSYASPENNETDVSSDKAVTVTFSEPMKSWTITTDSFTVNDGTVDIPGVVTYDGVTGTFVPEENLVFNTVYTGVITTRAADLAGNPLKEDYTWSFATGSEPDTTPPSVTSTIPEDEETHVSVDKSVAATFSEPMKSRTVTTASFYVSDGTNDIPGTVKYDGTTATFIPAEDFDYSTVYTARIIPEVTDLAENKMESEYTWSFTTGNEPDTDKTRPMVSNVSPDPNALNVAWNAAVTTTFSEPIKSSTITTATFYVADSTGIIPGAVAYNGITATFIPAENFAPGTDYTVVISVRASDLSGNGLENDYTWSFKTGAEQVMDNIPPTVSNVSPGAGSVNTALNTAVTATFSEPVKSSSVTTATFYVTDATGVKIAGTVRYEGTTATFKPGDNFSGNTGYTATITNAVRDLAGNPMKIDYTWSFTTGAEPDITRPMVSFTAPANGTDNIAVNTAVIATFSEPVKSSAITTTSFTVNDGTGNITGTVTYNETTATFTPTGELSYHTTYTALITDAEDLAGNRLENPYSWSFTTGSESDTIPPKVISVFPGNEAFDVTFDSSVSASFSEPMKSFTISTASFIVSNGADNISGTVTYNGTTATFTPAENFAPGTEYTAVITAKAGDIAGNRLEAPYTWSFKTGDERDTARPTVIFTFPENDSSDIALDVAVSAEFSEPMKPSTVTAASFLVNDGSVTGTVAYNGTAATFTPSASLSSGSFFTVTITADAEDLAGNTLKNDYKWSFETGYEPHDPEPVVTSTVPADNTYEIALDESVLVTFSEPVKPSAINNGTFFISNGSVNIPGTVTYDGTNGIFTPMEDFSYDTLYTATVTSDVEDFAGKNMENNYVWSFTTVGELPNNPPDTPSPLSPGNRAISAPGTPVILTATMFTDIDTQDTHYSSYWQIRGADGELYEYEVSKQETDDLTKYELSGLAPGMKYFWRVRYEDSRGGISEWSDMCLYEPVFITGMPGIDENVRIEDRTEKSEYRMASFVIWPDNPLSMEVFGDEINNDYNRKKIRILSYDPETRNYIECDSNFEVEPGKAYWFLARNGLDITVNGILVSTDHDVEVRLKKGWNMIGCPNNAEYDWNNVQVIQYSDTNNCAPVNAPVTVSLLDNNIIEKELWRWNLGTYVYYDPDGLYDNEQYDPDPDSVMKPNNGYWVKANEENILLRFPADAQGVLPKNEAAIKNIVRRGKIWIKNELLSPSQAIADSDDSPPLPVGDLNSDSSGTDASGGGCFIGSSSHDYGVANWMVTLFCLLSVVCWSLVSRKSKIIIIMIALFMHLPADAQENKGRPYFDFGVFAFEDNDYNEAEKYFKIALKFNPDNPYYNHYMGKTLIKMAKEDNTRYRDAEKYLANALETDKNIPGLKFDMAFLKFKISDYSGAVELFKEITEQNPSDVLALYYTGMTLFKLKQFSDAPDYLMRAAEISPSVRADCYYVAGICYHKAGNSEKAVELFEHVEKSDSGHLREKALKWLGVIEEQQRYAKPYHLYSRLGYQYDDNVRLSPDEDEFADEDDYATVAYFSGMYNFVNTKECKIGAGYSHYQTWYNDLSQYDITGSIFSVYAKYRFNPVTLGLSYVPDYYWVDSESYSRRHRFKPELGLKISDNITTRFSYSYSDNTYFQDSGKDGHTNEYLMDFFCKISQKTDHYLTGGIAYEDRTASDSDQCYGRLKLNLGIYLKLPWSFNLVLAGQYHDKKYDNPDSDYGIERDDGKYSGSVSVSRNLLYEWLSITAAYDYTDNDSNINSKKYTRNVMSLSFTGNY